MNIYRKLILQIVLLCFTGLYLSAQNNQENSAWNVADLIQKPEYRVISHDNGVCGIIYKGAVYKGAKSDVFAYYSTPGILKGDTSLDKKLPAVVCVHGGGGKAYMQWVKSWAEKGFAAISMDLRGYGPDSTRLPNGFIENNFKTPYFTCNENITSDWFYQAVSNVVYAHSLLLSFKEVDSQKTAITGISWGGIITSLVSGLDNRFKVACPVYGCGYLYKSGSMAPQIARQLEFAQKRWKEQYDPSVYLMNAQIPILFVNGTNDNHFFLDQFSETYNLVKDRDLSIRVGLKHGHIPAWKLPEVQNYITALLKIPNAIAPVKITDMKVANKKITASFSNNVNKVFMNYTLSNTLSPKSEWIEQAIPINGNKINCELVPDCKFWFLSVEDHAKNRMSTGISSN